MIDRDMAIGVIDERLSKRNIDPIIEEAIREKGSENKKCYTLSEMKQEDIIPSCKQNEHFVAGTSHSAPAGHPEIPIQKNKGAGTQPPNGEK